MKKGILLAIGFILSSYSYADIDLSKNYGGATEWGYSGFEIGSNFVITLDFCSFFNRLKLGFTDKVADILVIILLLRVFSYD